MARRRPTVALTCPADQYARTGERIVEFGANDGTGRGGLIALTKLENGDFRVEIYRCSEGVQVIAPCARCADDPGRAKHDA